MFKEKYFKDKVYEAIADCIENPVYLSDLDLYQGGCVGTKCSTCVKCGGKCTSCTKCKLLDDKVESV